MSVLLAEIEQRWVGMFSALAAGRDVAPTTRLRTEGLMEAAVLLEGTDADTLMRTMEEVYTSVCGGVLEEHLGENWRAFYPFPQIPVVAQRAPVYPSTKE